LILILCVVFATPALPHGMSAPAGALVAEAADYSVGTEIELRAALATAANGAVIEVVADIELTGGALVWDNRTLTITGRSGDVTLRRGKDFPDEPIMEIGGKDTSQTTPAGVILEKIIIDDNNQKKGSYDGVLCAYRQNVKITLGDSATIRRAGGGGGVYLSGAPSSGPKLTMQDGGLIMDAKSKTGAPGAGVFVGTGAAFTMEGGSIRNNVTTSAGGGVYVAGGATFVMKDGLIRGNTAPAGGGVLVSGDGDGGAFTMEGGVITGNMLSGTGVSKNQHGQDIAVEAPYGPTPPDYAKKAFFAEIHPAATIDAGKIGVQNRTPGGGYYGGADGKVFNQAVYLPSSRSASVRVGALDQYGDTTALDALTSAAIAAMPVATYSGLTYAGNIVYAPANNSGRIEVTLNYPDEIDSVSRNQYSYEIAYVPLNPDGTTAGAVKFAAAGRSSESNIIAEFTAEPGAAAYGVVKYYYEKFGAFDVTLSSVGLGGGSLVEKNSGLSGPLRFESIPSGSGGFTPSPSAFTLRAISADDSWKVGSVKVTAGDKYVIWKDVDANGGFILYYTDLAPGVNRVEVEFVPSDGSVRLSMDDASFVYDDRPHSMPVSGLARGDEVLYQYRVGDSDFFTSANGSPTFRDVNRVVADSRGVSEEEIIVYVTVTRGAVSARDSASLTISPRPVTVKPVDREKEYDGSPLTPNAAEVSAGTLLAGHRLDVSSAVFGGSRIRVGTSESTVTGVSVAGTNPANYAISYALGRLTVTAPAEDEDDEDDGRDKKEKDKKDKMDDDGGGGYVPGGGADGPDDGADVEGAEQGAGGEVTPGDGVEGGDEGATLGDSPVPTTTKEDENGLPPYWFIWLIIVIIAAGLWFLIVFWRKRRRDDEEGFDESDRF
jgi:hypothetical protein